MTTAISRAAPSTGAVPANYGMSTPCDVPTGLLMPLLLLLLLLMMMMMMMMMICIAAGIRQNDLLSQSVIANNLSVSRNKRQT